MKKNFTNILIKQAENQPDAIAIITNNESISYKELNDIVWKCSTYLQTHNVKKGDVVISMYDNQLMIAIITLAVSRIGASSLTLPSTTKKEFLASVIKESRATTFVSDFENVEIQNISQLIVDKECLKNETINYKVIVLEPQAPSQILIGSGSTGKKKLIVLSHLNENIRLEYSKKWLSFDVGDRVTSFAHLAYFAARVLLFETLFAGATYVIFSDEEKSIISLEKNGITILHTPVLYVENLLNNLTEHDTERLYFLTKLIIGGSTVNSRLRNLVQKHLTKNINVRYGINEIGSVTVASLQNGFLLESVVGFPIDKRIKVEVVDENGNKKEINEIGHIRIKSLSMVNGYMNDDEATKKAFKDGWFYPNDIGKFSDNGELIHLGRSDDMMVMNGINIYPNQIENAMLTHEDIKEAIAFPIKSELHQDIPVCTVVVEKESKETEENFMEYALNHLGSYRPQVIMKMDKIPRNEQGKVEIRKLISMAKKRVFFLPKQPRQIFTLTLNKDLNVNLSIVDKWLKDVFKLEINNNSNTKNLTKKEKYIFDVAYRILLLRKEFLQSLYIPVFDTGEINSISSKNNDFVLSISITRIENISDNIYITSMNKAINLVLKQMLEDVNHEQKEKIFNSIITNLIQPFRSLSGSGKSTLPILKEAYNKNIPFSHLGGGIYRLGWGNNSKILSKSSSELDSAIGMYMSENKYMSTLMMKDIGLPVPKNFLVFRYEEAIEAAKKLNFPIVTKPTDQNRGEGVSIDIFDLDSLKVGFNLAYEKSKSKQVLVEEQISGVCHRIFIANRKMFYAVKRLPKSVIADGIQSIEKLIKQANKNNSNLPPWKRSEYFPDDTLAKKAIEKVGLSMKAVPKKGRIVPLRNIESTNWGGFDVDVSTNIHEENIRAAIKAANLFGLHVAGVDIISTDISKPWYENGAIINEVNFAPLYGGGDISKKTIPSFLNEYIKDDGRIPIQVVIGDESAFKAAIKLQDLSLEKSVKSFVTTHNKTLSYSKKEVHYMYDSLYLRIKTLLNDKEVGELIVVVQTDELLNSGLPMDMITKVSVVSNNLIKKISEKKFIILIERFNAISF